MTYTFSFRALDRARQHAGDRSDDAVVALLGGKGANLAEMTRIGVPVPPGFTITTEACNAFLAAGEQFPDGMWEEVVAELQAVEQLSAKRFGDPENPLLLSCRSGARFSMPGMMDTVLDIGLNDEVARGMVRLTEDPQFVYDSYRRLLQMFATVVMGVRDEPFEEVLAAQREARGVTSDADLDATDLEAVVAEFKDIISRTARHEFPNDPYEQLRLAIAAVFQSWRGKRAIDYRNAAGIDHDLGTGVNIQAMVFGNTGQDSATGVAMSRNATTGENRLEGDFLVNAQGEDVVAGTRTTLPIAALGDDMPELFTQFQDVARRLEEHYCEMQDMEFTIERGKLWLLQTRTGKRTAQAAVRIAVEMTEQGLITRDEALLRVRPEHIDFFLHPQFCGEACDAARKAGRLLATGLNVSPGAAVGIIAFGPDQAERWAKEEGRPVIMVRPETKPDDVHGMLAAQGVLTCRGGRTSHAALVARQFGKPAVVGVTELCIDLGARRMQVGEQVFEEGDWLSIDGSSGEVYAGQLSTVVPDLQDPSLLRLLTWADGRRRLRVRANADYPRDAVRARQYGAEGIGLCRTEHMFFETQRMPVVRKMIMAQSVAERREALAELLPLQRADFLALFQAMDGLPVIVRLLDPPLHEFLPDHDELVCDIADLKIRLLRAGGLPEVDEILHSIHEKQTLLDRVSMLREANPMLGLRGVRLGITMPEIVRMQVRALLEAAIAAQRSGTDVRPEIMVPLTSHVGELRSVREIVDQEAQEVFEEEGMAVRFQFGTMIEIPRAALTCDELVEYAEFLSFGTNDLTQTTYGISRDDAESGFLISYLSTDILPENPFHSIDERGVGQLMGLAVQLGRAARPGLEIGICGEHGGDPQSIAFCHLLGIDYVSCSPFRVPVARLAAAQAAIQAERLPAVLEPAAPRSSPSPPSTVHS